MLTLQAIGLTHLHLITPMQTHTFNYCVFISTGDGQVAVLGGLLRAAGRQST